MAADGTIDRLIVDIESNATNVSGGLDKIASSLSNLRSAASNFRSLNVFAKSLEEVKKSTVGFDGTAAQSLNLMTDALSKLHVLDGVKLSTSIASQLKSIGEATRGLSGVDWSELRVMTESLAPISGIQKSNGLNNTVNALRKMPDAIRGINQLDPDLIAEFSEKVEQLRVVIHPLADEMRAVAAGFSALPANIQKAIKANQKLTSSNEKTSRSFGSILKRVVSVSAAFYGFRKLFSFAMDAFEASNNFIESLNLAEVAMGEGSKAAVEYAEKVERLAGIDMSKWITQVGTFNQQLEGFGIPADKANQMAQTLTQLGYDIQSAFNVSDLSTVMDRLSSGISGQIKGMRSYGVELSVAAMQEFALSHGITEQWKNMSQAQKVALRYAKIMEQTTNIQGDLARTIITPANSLRILQSQFGIAARYIGQIVSVIAAKVIPVFSAIAQVIGMAAKAIASFFGFTLPDISASVGKDFDIAVGGAEDLEDAIGGAGGAAKDAKNEIKGLLAGWDEINIIQQQNDTAGSGGGGGGGGSIGDIGDLIDIGQYGYDFLKGIQNNVDELIAKIKRFMPEILSFLAAVTAFGIGQKVIDLAKYLGVAADKITGMRNILAGIALAIVGITLSWQGIHKIYSDGLSTESVLETIAGNVADIFGFGLIGRGIGKLRGGKGKSVNAFQFGIGAAIAVDALSLMDVATDDLKANGISAKAVISDIASAVGMALGISASANALGLGRGASMALGIGAAITVNALELTKVAVDRIATNGIDSANLLLTIGNSIAAAFGVGIGAVSLGLGAPIAIALGSIVGLALGIATIKIGLDEKAKREAQEKFKSEVLDAFGDVSITQDEANAIAYSIMNDDFHVDLMYTLRAAESLETMKSTIQGTVDELNLMDYKTSIGVNLAPDEAETYATKAGQLATEISNRLAEGGKFVSMSLDLTDMDSAQIDSLVSSNSTWITEIGAKAQELLSAAFDENGGLIDIDAKKEADKYLQTLYEVNRLIQESQAEARFSSLQLSYSGVELTAESAGMVSNAIVDYLKEENEAAQSIYESTYSEMALEIKVAEYRLEQDPNNQALKDAVAQAQSTLDEYVASNPLEAQMHTRKLKISEWLGNTWGDTLGTYLFSSQNMSDLSEDINATAEQMLVQATSELSYGQISQDTRDWAAALGQNIYDSLGGALSDVRVDEDANDWLSVFAEYGGASAQEAIDQLRIGEKPAQDIIDGLNNYMIVAAREGTDANALWYMVGQQLAQSQDYLNLLNTMEGLGSDLNEYTKLGILANLDTAKDGVGLIASAIDGQVSAEIPKVTDTFWDNLALNKPDVGVTGTSDAALTMPAIDTDTLYKPSLTGAETDALTTKGNIETNLETVVSAPDLTDFNAGLDTMVENAQTAANSVNSILGSAGTRSSGGFFSNLFGGIFGRKSISLAPDIPHFTIPAYAGGGFPTQGQLFIANEQGPELVGQMGSSPAVANGDQIITGITEGVSRGQEEQNRLLREQNELLRGLLSKETSVVLRPSAEFGRMNQRSYEMYKKVGG